MQRPMRGNLSCGRWSPRRRKSAAGLLPSESGFRMSPPFFMRRYVRLFSSLPQHFPTLAAFVKFPVLEKLENEHLLIFKERSDMIAQRRKADDEDDLSLF